VTLVFAYLHHLAAFALVAALSVELVLLRLPLDSLNLIRLQRVDLVYGLAAVLILVAGFGRALFFEKGWAWYAANPAFAWKLALFLLVGVISIYPTLRFMQWRKQLRLGRRVQVSARDQVWLPRAVTLELVLVAVIVACAILMARGVVLAA
jgi:putative membrane protein